MQTKTFSARLIILSVMNISRITAKSQPATDQRKTFSTSPLWSIRPAAPPSAKSFLRTRNASAPYSPPPYTISPLGITGTRNALLPPSSPRSLNKSQAGKTNKTVKVDNKADKAAKAHKTNKAGRASNLRKTTHRKKKNLCSAHGKPLCFYAENE